jgi:hypothetical protein
MTEPRLALTIIDSPESKFLLEQKAWACSILAAPEVRWEAGSSHEIAQRVLEETEDKLIDHLGIKGL